MKFNDNTLTIDGLSIMWTHYRQTTLESAWRMQRCLLLLFHSVGYCLTYATSSALEQFKEK